MKPFALALLATLTCAIEQYRPVYPYSGSGARIYRSPYSYPAHVPQIALPQAPPSYPYQSPYSSPFGYGDYHSHPVNDDDAKYSLYRLGGTVKDLDETVQTQDALI